jgi:RHS repeat-associated protein
MITKTITQRFAQAVILGLVLLMSVWTSAHAGTVTYYYTDPQGTPLAEADAQGNITSTFDYRPYGAQALGTPPKGPGYTGHVNDPDTGLVYMQARYYDPAVGRFISIDPVGPSASDLFGFNRYDYADSNPINRTDPNGRCADGFSCDQVVQSYGRWANANPEQADKLGRAVGVPGVMIMAAPTVGAASIAVLSSPLPYLALTFATDDFDVVEALKAAEERRVAAELVADSKNIEKLLEELLKAAEKNEVPPPPPKPPAPPSPPKSPATAPIAKPETHSSNEAIILRDEFSHDGQSLAARAVDRCNEEA